MYGKVFRLGWQPGGVWRWCLDYVVVLNGRGEYRPDWEVAAMPLGEREVVQQAMEALGVRTVFIYRPESDREIAYEDGELVEITTGDVYASCTPNDDGSWDCTRYILKVELEPGLEAKTSQEAVERCVEQFGIERVLVIDKDSWAWYDKGEWVNASVEDVVAIVQKLEVPFATCQWDESGQWLGFPPGGEPDEEKETVTLY